MHTPQTVEVMQPEKASAESNKLAAYAEKLKERMAQQELAVKLITKGQQPSIQDLGNSAKKGIRKVVDDGDIGVVSRPNFAYECLS